MNIFGDFYNRAYGYKQSRHEQQVAHSEDWSAAVLSGSEQAGKLEQPLSGGYLRFFLVSGAIAVFVLVGQLFYVQITRGQQNLVLANGNRIRQSTIRAPRGAIYDRNKQILARNLASFDLVVNPSQMPRGKAERAAIYATIAGLIGQQPAEVQNKAEVKGKVFTQNVLIASNLDRETALNVEEKTRQITGFSIDINPSREYLDDGPFAHFLGYTGRISAEEWRANPGYQPTDYIGKSGLEQSYEDELKGKDGKKQVEVDAQGRQIRELAAVPAEAGNSLVLAVDSGLEKKLAQELKASVERAGAKRAAAVAMDPRNGQILAAVNWPGYDNNLFAKGISSADYQKLLADPGNPLFNKVAGGRYPVASTIKPFISIAALEEQIITASTSIKDEGKIDVVNKYNPSITYTYRGWEAAGLGQVNVVKAIAKSSDVFYYIVGGGFENFRGLGADKLLGWYKKFGLGTKTGIDLANESAGYLPNPSDKKAQTGEPWYVGDTYNISIGQGNLQATPLQLVTATSAVGNGGTLYKPRLAKEVINQKGERVREIKPEVVATNFINPKNLAIVQQGMREVVQSGTACCRMKAEVPVSVAGKTGTAETSSAGLDGKNTRTKPHAWFTAYAPAENPEIAMVVLIEYAGEGAEYAAPVARETLKWYFGGRP